jgi:hypothetical protein
VRLLHRGGLAKIPGAVLLLAAALALPAAAQPRYGPRGTPHRTYVPRGVVDGVLSDEGGRCPVLRDRQNRNYYLLGDTRGLRPGDQVSLRERLLNRSSCGNDAPTLEVLEVRTVWTDGAHSSAYFDARRDGDFGRFILRSRDRGGWYSDRYTYLRQGRAPQGGQYDDRYDRSRQYDSPPYVPPYAGPDQDRGRSDDRGQYDRRQQPQPNESYDSPDSDPGNDQNDQYEDGYAPNDIQDDAPQGNAPDDTYDRGDVPEDRSSGNRQLITVDGTFEFDSTCPSLRGTDGKSYDLAGELGNSHDGDRVRVRGFLAGRSSCGGTALEVQEIRRR